MPETRQLAAIMLTDIVGYSAFMGHDETSPCQLLKKNRHFQKSLREKHGDNWLTEMDEKEQVFERLGKSFHDHEVEKYWPRVEPTFESPRDNPRWKEMPANVGFLE